MEQGPKLLLSCSFPAWTGSKSGTASHPNRQLPSTLIRALRGVSQAANGCAVHDSGQICTCEGYFCATFRAFTSTLTVPLIAPRAFFLGGGPGRREAAAILGATVAL